MTFTDDNEVIMNAMEDSFAEENLEETGEWPQSETRMLIWVAAIALIGMGIFIFLMKRFILTG